MFFIYVKILSLTVSTLGGDYMIPIGQAEILFGFAGIQAML